MNAFVSFAADHPVLLGVAVAAVVLLATVGRSHGRTKRVLGKVRPRVSTVFLSAVGTAVVIVAVEWIVVSSNPSTRTLLAVLAVPALLAGAAVGRLVAAAQLGNHIERGVRR